MSVVVRSATPEDLAQVRDIFEHYVLNTVVSFLVQTPPADYVANRFQDSTARNLPYLVAVTDGGSVMGYCYAAAFRGFMLGYGHTVEISVFCHPRHLHQGIGRQMLQELLRILKTTEQVTREVGHESSPVRRRVKKVMAIMAVDESAPGEGLALRDWYHRWGFEQVGRLKGVGLKHGKVLDTIYLELDLDKPDST